MWLRVKRVVLFCGGASIYEHIEMNNNPCLQGSRIAQMIGNLSLVSDYPIFSKDFI